ncbi:MAG: response regulator [Dehalococcoidales bacterium]|nr:response regulator [Dehalococcoidales bacterium]
MANQHRDFVIRHLREVLVGAIAEVDGNDTLSRCLHARAKLRLITMSEEELQELAGMVSCPPDRPIEIVYQGLKSEIAELKQTANEWMKELHRDTVSDPEGDKQDRVLIVEPEDSLRKVLISAFNEAGFLTVDVSDYSQTLQRLYEFKIDLVVMDSSLPDWDGFEACSELRNRFDIPVILLGRESGNNVWKKISEVGAEHYEIKPCKYLALVARAKAILRRYKLKPFRSVNDLPLYQSPVQRSKDRSYLSDQDIEAGFSITLDDQGNITLLKLGDEVAWFSAALATEEVMNVFIRLIKECGCEGGAG